LKKHLRNCYAVSFSNGDLSPMASSDVVFLKNV